MSVTQIVRWTLVRVLLSRTFAKMLSRQIFLKLTKFTRRSRDPKDFVSKVGKACGFLRDMCQHNLRAINRAQMCLETLAASGIQEVALYGSGHVAEILYNLTYNIPVKIIAIYDDCGEKRFLGFNIRPLEESAKGEGKVIIASLVAMETRLERLRGAGVDKKRIVVLN